MEKWIVKFSSDPTWMFIGAMALVVALFVMLVVVISTMMVKSYKERFVNLLIDNESKTQAIAKLKNEQKKLQSKVATQAELLEQYEKTKERLQQKEIDLDTLQKKHEKLEKLHGHTVAKLHHAKRSYHRLDEAYLDCKESLELLEEENSKLRVNNARLLTKLEMEERQREH